MSSLCNKLSLNRHNKEIRFFHCHTLWRKNNSNFKLQLNQLNLCLLESASDFTRLKLDDCAPPLFGSQPFRGHCILIQPSQPLKRKRGGNIYIAARTGCLQTWLSKGSWLLTSCQRAFMLVRNGRFFLYHWVNNNVRKWRVILVASPPPPFFSWDLVRPTSFSPLFLPTAAANMEMRGWHHHWAPRQWLATDEITTFCSPPLYSCLLPPDLWKVYCVREKLLFSLYCTVFPSSCGRWSQAPMFFKGTPSFSDHNVCPAQLVSSPPHHLEAEGGVCEGNGSVLNGREGKTEQSEKEAVPLLIWASTAVHSIADLGRAS